MASVVGFQLSEDLEEFRKLVFEWTVKIDLIEEFGRFIQSGTSLRRVVW